MSVLDTNSPGGIWALGVLLVLFTLNPLCSPKPPIICLGGGACLLWNVCTLSGSNAKLLLTLPQRVDRHSTVPARSHFKSLYPFLIRPQNWPSAHQS